LVTPGAPAFQSMELFFPDFGRDFLSIRELAERYMSNKYKVRMYESGDGDRATLSGTIVLPIDRSFAVHASSAEDAESTICQDVREGKLPFDRIYQICPPSGDGEQIRSIVISKDGGGQAVFLDQASGLYSEFRRLRHA
jgi:hypothetical protein